MENKIIDLSDTVYNLCKKHPSLSEVLKEIGFTEIRNPVMLNTAGRFMTLEKGAKHKKIDIETIKQHLITHGYSVQ